MATRKLIVEVIGDSSSLERSLTRSTRQTQVFGREFSKAERGVLSGSGVFHSLGRSVAFASAAFIGTAGLTAALKDSIENAETAERAHASLATALDKVGASAKGSLPAIDEWAAQQAKFGVSANDAITGLSRLVQLTGSARKAMDAYTAALEISRGTGRNFNTVSLAVGKAFAGQTTALARYIGSVKKGTTETQLFSLIQSKFGGQAAANTLVTDRLRAEVMNLEAEIGTALLPTVDALAKKLADWLDKSENQARIQRDVTHAVGDATSAFNAIKGAVEDVDRVTGSFKHTLELLLALKIASTTAGWISSFGKLGTSMGKKGAAGEASLLSRNLGALKALGVIGITVAVSFEAVKTGQALSQFLGKTGIGKALGIGDTPLPPGVSFNDVAKLKTDLDAGNLTTRDRSVFKSLTGRNAATGSITGGADQHAALATNAQRKADTAAVTTAAAKHGIDLTAKQSNTFFDNSIARILLRGGLGSINQQIAALTKADSLITARIAKTKDVTRKLNLEDQLLTNQAQIRSLKGQQAAAAQQAALAAHQKAVNAVAARASARQSRQFRELGFTSTGDNVTPGVPRLKKELSSLGDAVKGTKFDTPALATKFKNIGKVLSEGIVPRDVRQKIQEMLAGVQSELDAFAKKQSSQTGFQHQSANAIVNRIEAATGLDLTASQRRALRAQVSTIGAGGTTPSQSRQFGAGITVQSDVYLDGQKISRNTTGHQAKAGRRRTTSRRGA